MEKILLSHGSGGTLMHRLIDSLFMKEFGNPILREKKDSGIIKIGGRALAFTTDSYVVNPVFFPGGDIGSLAVYGTVNDLSVCGAAPLFISLGMIIEEGLDIDVLRRITCSIASAAKRAGVKIAAGDTKVVGKGSCDKIFINTSGIGEVYYPHLSAGAIMSGDSVILSGAMGDHAISVLSKREGISFSTSLKSDSAPLNALVAKVLRVSEEVKFMRDPTRGGVATTLNEMVKDNRFGIAIDEDILPISDGVRDACEFLGFDPLYLANEGRVIIIASRDDEQKILETMRSDPLGRKACVIGQVMKEHPGKVYMNTSSGGKRIVSMLSGEQLPRVC